MNNRLSVSKALAIAAVLLCAGCTQKPQPTAPNLVSAEDRQRARIDVASNNESFGTVSERLSAMAQDVYADTDVMFVANALNTGKSSQGVRVLVKGAAIAKGLLGDIKDANLRATMPNGKGSHTLELSLKPIADGSALEAESLGFEYGDTLDLSMRLRGLKNGTGDVVVFIYPLDPKGTTSAVFQKNYRVLNEHENSESQAETEGQ
jgi:hypothetical protein